MKNSALTLAIATMMAAVSVQAQEHASSVQNIIREAMPAWVLG
jgi:hypothetical protein